MTHVHELINELNESGIKSWDLVGIAKELTQISAIKERIINRLSNFYSEEEVRGMIDIVERPNMQQITSMEVFSPLSAREKECYLKHTFDGMAFTAIGEELGISKGAVQKYIERSRGKLQIRQG